MIPYSRPNLSDLYTLSQSKLLEKHTLHSFTAAHTYHSPYMAAPPYPPGTTTATCCSERHVTLIKPLITKAAEMKENLCKQINKISGM